MDPIKPLGSRAWPCWPWLACTPPLRRLSGARQRASIKTPGASYRVSITGFDCRGGGDGGGM